jgi:sarcosine oxidase gamma subunit
LTRTVSVRPATVTGSVCTVAAAAEAVGPAEWVLLADVPAADAAVTLPTAATAARAMPPMMIFG